MTMAIYSLSLSFHLPRTLSLSILAIVVAAATTSALSLWLYQRFSSFFFCSHPIRGSYVCEQIVHTCVAACGWMGFELIERNKMILHYCTWNIYIYVCMWRCYVCLCKIQTHINAHIKWDSMILIHFHRHVSCAHEVRPIQCERISERQRTKTAAMTAAAAAKKEKPK